MKPDCLKQDWVVLAALKGDDFAVWGEDRGFGVFWGAGDVAFLAGAAAANPAVEVILIEVAVGEGVAVFAVGFLNHFAKFSIFCLKSKC